MIPAHLRSKIAKRITEECETDGPRDDIGSFLFAFAALETDRDAEYALEELGSSGDVLYKKAINIVLDEVIFKKIRRIHSSTFPTPTETMEASAIVNAYLNGFPAPYEPWHHIDNANGDLLREIIKQLVFECNNLKGKQIDLLRGLNNG
jgi:hypothetical protein